MIGNVGLRRVLLLFAVATMGWPQAAWAHGKAVSVNLTPGKADAGQPLVREFTASVLFSDGDPVDGAAVILSGTAPSHRNLRPVSLLPEGNGQYRGEVRFPAVGRWRMTVEVSGPGKGSASFTHQIAAPADRAGEESAAEPRPGQGAESLSAPGTGQASEGRVLAAPRTAKPLKIRLSFGAGDFANLIVRALHMVAAVVWVGGMVFFLLVLRPMSRKLTEEPPALAEGYRRFGTVAAASLAVLLLTGAYNAVFNLPNSTLGLGGGLLSLETLRAQPYGEAYTGLLLGKLGLVVLMVGIAGVARWLYVPRLTLALATAAGRGSSLSGSGGAVKSGVAGAGGAGGQGPSSQDAGPGGGGQGAVNPRGGDPADVARQLTRLTAANLALGITVIAITVGLAYLHMIGHATKALFPAG